MSSDKLADAQKKLELATNLVVAYINANKPEKGEKASKTADTHTPGEKEVLDLLSKVFDKMNELVPYSERKMGISA